MNVAKRSPLLSILSGESTVSSLDAAESSLMLAEARACGVLGRLAYAAQTTETEFFSLPERLKSSLQAARIQAEGFQTDVWRELAHIKEALSELQTPVIVLKGASYVLQGLPAANGRMFSDIDILVEKSLVPSAEAALMKSGWSTGKLNAYDHRYYREWSHEIPPMTHLRRGTSIDLHHSLVMPTCRIRVDSHRMVADAIPAIARDGVAPSGSNEFWWRLCDEDMILHAASHLILNSEFDRGLRDLWDIDLLYRHFSTTTVNFPNRLLIRAGQLGLDEILGQALRLSRTIFRTPCLPSLHGPDSGFFTSVLARAATTRHPETRPRGQALADWALMLREMYLRLPNQLLLIHLLHKARQVLSSPEKSAV